MGILPEAGTTLTPAELAAVRAWLEHRSIPGAARALKRSPYTVAQQLRNARSRLGARKLEDLDDFVLGPYPPG